MTTQYTTILKLALPVQGELAGTWGDVVNNNITSMVEEAVAGRKVINTWNANSHTLTSADGTTSEARAAILTLTDTGTTLTGAGSVVCPAASKIYIVENSTAQIITVKTASGTGIAVPVGKNMVVFCDGTNVEEGISNIASLSIGGDGATVTGIKDEDNMASNSATKLATQQSIKAYVDSQVTVQDLDVTDGSASIDIDLDSESLGILGGTGIDSTASGTAVTLAVDATVATLTGSQTLTNKTLTSPDVNTPDIDGGTIDGTTIGGSTPAAGSFTTVAASGNVDFNGDVDVDGTLETDALTIGGVTSVPFESADHSKLDGIEANADVTDATNVTAAGALMDSEVTNLAQVKAFDSSDYATSAQGTTANAALPKAGGAMTGAITTNSTFDGRDVATDGTKLDGIEASADVTDATNVTAAGALMDSELTSIASVKAMNQGVATTNSPTFAGITTSADSTIGTDKKLIFRDSAIHISSTADGDLSIAADDEIDLTSTLIDVNGNLDVSGTTNTVNFTVSGAQGSDGQVLTSTGSGVGWENASGGIADVAADTSPQLGGNLDVNGHDIISASNGAIELDPNGSGKVVFKGNSTKGAGQFVLNCEQNSHGITIKGPPHSASASYTLTLPNDDGSSNQLLKTDGSGNLSWTTVSGGVSGISSFQSTTTMTILGGTPRIVIGQNGAANSLDNYVLQVFREDNSNTYNPSGSGNTGQIGFGGFTIYNSSTTNNTMAGISFANGAKASTAYSVINNYAIRTGTVEADLVWQQSHGSNSVELMRLKKNQYGQPRLGVANNNPTSTLDVTGDAAISGALSKGSGSFKIDHPLPAKAATHHLVHSFIEGPQADNIYRGKIDLVDGTATVNIDTEAGMTEGTYVLLNTNTQCFTSNESGWTAVKGSVSGNMLTIAAQDNTCTDTISWMVVGERKDPHMIDTEWTDENGKVIVEPLKENN